MKHNVGLGQQCLNLLTNNVLLIETETIVILDLVSHIVRSEDKDEYNSINEKNEVYLNVRHLLY